jgi:hypothetical protein
VSKAKASRYESCLLQLSHFYKNVGNKDIIKMKRKTRSVSSLRNYTVHILVFIFSKWKYTHYSVMLLGCKHMSKYINAL